MITILLFISLLVFICVTVNAIHALIALILLFLNFTIILFQLQVPFLGFAYLLVYVGALSVLFLFVITLINLRIISISHNSNLLLLLCSIQMFIIINTYIKINIPFTSSNLLFTHFSDIQLFGSYLFISHPSFMFLSLFLLFLALFLVLFLSFKRENSHILMGSPFILLFITNLKEPNILLYLMIALSMIIIFSFICGLFNFLRDVIHTIVHSEIELYLFYINNPQLLALIIFWSIIFHVRVYMYYITFIPNSTIVLLFLMIYSLTIIFICFINVMRRIIPWDSLHNRIFPIISSQIFLPICLVIALILTGLQDAHFCTIVLNLYSDYFNRKSTNDIPISTIQPDTKSTIQPDTKSTIQPDTKSTIQPKKNIVKSTIMNFFAINDNAIYKTHSFTHDIKKMNFIDHNRYSHLITHPINITMNFYPHTHTHIIDFEKRYVIEKNLFDYNLNKLKNDYNIMLNDHYKSILNYHINSDYLIAKEKYRLSIKNTIYDILNKQTNNIHDNLYINMYFDELTYEIKVNPYKVKITCLNHFGSSLIDLYIKEHHKKLYNDIYAIFRSSYNGSSIYYTDSSANLMITTYTKPNLNILPNSYPNMTMQDLLNEYHYYFPSTTNNTQNLIYYKPQTQNMYQFYQQLIYNITQMYILETDQYNIPDKPMLETDQYNIPNKPKLDTNDLIDMPATNIDMFVYMQKNIQIFTHNKLQMLIKTHNEILNSKYTLETFIKNTDNIKRTYEMSLINNVQNTLNKYLTITQNPSNINNKLITSGLQPTLNILPIYIWMTQLSDDNDSHSINLLICSLKELILPGTNFDNCKQIANFISNIQLINTININTNGDYNETIMELTQNKDVYNKVFNTILDHTFNSTNNEILSTSFIIDHITYHKNHILYTKLIENLDIFLNDSIKDKDFDKKIIIATRNFITKNIPENLWANTEEKTTNKKTEINQLLKTIEENYNKKIITKRTIRLIIPVIYDTIKLNNYAKAFNEIYSDNQWITAFNRIPLTLTPDNEIMNINTNIQTPTKLRDMILSSHSKLITSINPKGHLSLDQILLVTRTFINDHIPKSYWSTSIDDYSNPNKEINQLLGLLAIDNKEMLKENHNMATMIKILYHTIDITNHTKLSNKTLSNEKWLSLLKDYLQINSEDNTQINDSSSSTKKEISNLTTEKSKLILNMRNSLYISYTEYIRNITIKGEISSKELFLVTRTFINDHIPKNYWSTSSNEINNPNNEINQLITLLANDYNKSKDKQIAPMIKILSKTIEIMNTLNVSKEKPSDDDWLTIITNQFMSDPKYTNNINIPSSSSIKEEIPDINNNNKEIPDINNNNNNKEIPDINNNNNNKEISLLNPNFLFNTLKENFLFNTSNPYDNKYLFQNINTLINLLPNDLWMISEVNVPDNNHKLNILLTDLYQLLIKEKNNKNAYYLAYIIKTIDTTNTYIITKEGNINEAISLMKDSNKVLNSTFNESFDDLIHYENYVEETLDK
jgi:NADH:ubiquinone oxidoreductase subunit 6 (subunit J)